MMAIRRFSVGWVLLLMVGMSGLQAQDAKDSKAKPDAAPCTTGCAPASSVAGPDYVIGSEDTLHVSVWKEPDLTATLPVRPDGKISLPLLNDVQAAGLTPMQLASDLTTRL